MEYYYRWLFPMALNSGMTVNEFLYGNVEYIAVYLQSRELAFEEEINKHKLIAKIYAYNNCNAIGNALRDKGKPSIYPQKFIDWVDGIDKIKQRTFKDNTEYQKYRSQVLREKYGRFNN